MRKRVLFHRFLMALSVRPSMCWAISAHLFPRLCCSSMMRWSSSSVHGPRLMVGSRWLYQLHPPPAAAARAAGCDGARRAAVAATHRGWLQRARHRALTARGTACRGAPAATSRSGTTSWCPAPRRGAAPPRPPATTHTRSRARVVVMRAGKCGASGDEARCACTRHAWLLGGGVRAAAAAGLRQPDRPSSTGSSCMPHHRCCCFRRRHPSSAVL